jgi:spore maturation protein CgeB
LQNQFYNNNKLSIQHTSKQIDEIRFNLLYNLSKQKKEKLKILHIANFNELSEGRLYYSFANKLNNGFLRNNNLVLPFGDRYFLKSNKSLFDPKGNIKLFNQKILSYLKNFSPDILLIGHVFNIDDEIFNYCKENNIKTAAWFIDSISKEFFYLNKRKLFLNNLRRVDKYFITSSPKKLKKIQYYKKIKFIPNPCDDLIDIYKNFSNPNLEYDLFIAISHGQNRGLLKKNKIDEREKLLIYLSKNLSKIKIAEFGYKGIEPIWGENYFYYLKKSKMSLNISRGKYQNLYSSDRISSLIGNGLLVFINSKTKMHKLLNKKEVVYYSNKEELVKKILFYFQHDLLRSKIAKKGYLKYHKHFSNKIVANYICGEIGLSKKINPIWKQ